MTRSDLGNAPLQGTRLIHWLSQPIDASALALFRILFGALMLGNTWVSLGTYHAIAHLQFRFVFVPGMPELSPAWAGPLWALTLIFALGITLGLFYRLACAGYLVCFGLYFLQEKPLFLNHYYLILLITLLLLTVDANARWSLDRLVLPSWRRARAASAAPSVPRWHVATLRAQVVIVYFYAGVAKISPDWLRGVPTGSQFRSGFADTPFAPLLETHAAAVAIAYAGMLFDLSIGFLLLMPRTRALATLACLAFHLTNHFVFHIGVFPWLMLATLTLFWPPDWPRRALEKLRRRGHATQASAAPTGGEPMRKAVALLLVVHFLLQVLLPLRHWAYPGNPAWTGEGRRFAWMMKLRSKIARVDYVAEEPETGERWKIDHRRELAPRQARMHARDPDMIWQYAQHLREMLEESGVEDPRITVETRVSMNGRPFQRMIDPTVDLAHAEYSWWRHAPWILPLRGHAVDLMPGEKPGAFQEPSAQGR